MRSVYYTNDGFPSHKATKNVINNNFSDDSIAIGILVTITISISIYYHDILNYHYYLPVLLSIGVEHQSTIGSTTIDNIQNLEVEVLQALSECVFIISNKCPGDKGSGD